MGTKLISEPLLAERLTCGRRKLQRELSVLVGDQEINVPVGFETDFSTYPQAPLVVALTMLIFFGGYSPMLFLLVLLIPKYSEVDIAGVVHDYLYKTGIFSKWKADKVWFHLALSGKHHAYYWQALPGWLVGLMIAGWPAWIKHRRASNS